MKRTSGRRQRGRSKIKPNASLDDTRLNALRPKPPRAEKDFGKDLKAHEALPGPTKELLLLQDQTEKSTGKEKAKLHKMTQDKSE